jgi:hypothetical protein
VRSKEDSRRPTDGYKGGVSVVGVAVVVVLVD